MTDETLPTFEGRIGGSSAVFPVIRVRFSGTTGRYTAVARWGDVTARATGYESPNTRTASESAVLAAWSAHVNLKRKVMAVRPGEDEEWWNARLQEATEPTRFTVIVTDESDIVGTGGGYLVSFLDRSDVIR